jgi:hypothetical protein
MWDFMTACDYCLSDCSDDGHSLDDEDCGPSPAPRVDILRELAVVPVPVGGQDTQLEQIREMQARLDEEAGQLVRLR